MENISIFEIKVLLIVIKEKNLSSAAKKVGLTQPGISRIIIKLEKNFSVKIFDKRKHPWELTTAGVILKEGFIGILNIAQETLEKLDDVVQNRKGSFNFATMAYEDRYLLPEVFTQFYKKYPNFKIKTFLFDAKDIEQNLIDHKTDFAHVLLPIKNDDIETIFLKEYEIIVCIPNRFLIEKNIDIPKENDLQEIDISLFKEYCFILRRLNLNFRNYENDIFKKSNFIPDESKIIEVPQYITGLNLANEGIGINFILDDVLKHIEKSTNVSFFKIKNIIPKQTLALAYLKNRNLSDIEEDFIKIMQKNIFI